ncbi:hypothetical protein CALVIDRAFT_513639 [Calocera viscosa TUFC12733]|uniref:RINT-1 family protein n=1 Tax=Calocera viscosa (strain TUFC12733) TaxID=1330018 RepID=A0A167N4F7_CALVF|nr:hypothetical protein CALVIDRAFT_513639 [Calocera viscosa TUFC12733]
MATTSIHSLLQPPDKSLSTQRAVDALNSEFPTWESLNFHALQAAVNRARAESDRLNREADESSRSREALIEETLTRARSSLASARELSLTRHTLVDQLSGLADEVLPPPGDERQTTLLELERLHAQLDELSKAREYADVVVALLELGEKAQTDIPPVISSSSLTSYKSLQAFVNSLVTSLPNSPPPSLSPFARGVQIRAWNHIRNALSSKLVEASEKLRWPLAVDLGSLTRPDLEIFSRGFLDLLQLQKVGDVLHASEPQYPGEPPRDTGLYPLQALVRPVAQRFKYHFESSRPTNRLDKPEWYFSHMLGVIRDTAMLTERVFQPLVDAGGYKQINARNEFTRLLLPILSRHLSLSVAQILSDPSLLAHTIYQTLEFDGALKDEGFSLKGTWESQEIQATEWEGLAGEILGDGDVFRSWLEGERKFTQARYEEMIAAPDAWTISDDEGASTDDDGTLRMTNSARRLRALVEQVTDRYAPLPSFSQQTSFLTSVQLPLLEAYHSRISASLDAFEALSTSFARVVPGALGGQMGASQRDLTAGVEGTDRLIKAWISAEGVIAGMEQWGEEVFFLELWNEINSRASLRNRAAVTSSLPDVKSGEDSIVEGTLFDEMIAQYRKLSTRAEAMIVKHVTGEVEAQLKDYFVACVSSLIPLCSRWNAPVSDSLGLPPILVPGLTSLTSHLTVLSRSLPAPFLTTVYRQVSSRLCSHILSRAVLHAGRGRYSPESGATFTRESQAWVEVCQGALAGKVLRVGRGWERLVEAGKILGIDAVDFGAAMRIVWGGSDKEFSEWKDKLGLRVMSREQVMEVMRARSDCGR